MKLEFPSSGSVDALRLADWLELYAILAPDMNASRGDLEATLRRSAFAEAFGAESIERLIIDVLEELTQRERSASRAYPFELNGQGLLQLRTESWEDYPAYIFCLLVSYLLYSSGDPSAKLFEEISGLAMKHYLNAEVLGFGFPRKEIPVGFSDAIDFICNSCGEGVGFKGPQTFDRKDDTVDLIAWKDFEDRLTSKLFIFGQCGLGEKWHAKLEEMQPSRFWDQWMRDALVSPKPVRSFFCPHRIPSSRWDLYARKAGILFDRCRVAFWAQRNDVDLSGQIDWARDQLASLS